MGYPTRPAELNFGGESFNVATLDPLRKGSTFIRDLEFTGIDLTGHSARMSVKKDYDSSPIIFFSSSESSAVLPRLIIDIPTNRIRLFAPEIFTSTLPIETSKNCRPATNKYKYDLEIITPTGEVYAFLEGEFWIVAEVTTES